MQTVTPDELFARGQRARAAGDTTRAEQYILAAVDRGYPSRAGTVALLEICIESDRYDTALHHGRRFLLERPDDWQLRYVVATLHVAVGEHSRARAQLERVIEDQPSWPDAHFLLATVAAERLDRPRLARVSFQRYLALAARLRADRQQ